MNQFVRNLAAGSVWAAVGFIFAIPLMVWGNEKAPEFYRSFAAAIVAAVAVVGGTYYQAEPNQRREEEAARRATIAEATDLFLWLKHAIGEMQFILRFMNGFRDQLVKAPEMTFGISQYSQAVSAPFMEELRSRAKSVARLSPLVGASVAPLLYEIFLTTDRVYRFRGAADVKLGSHVLDEHIPVTERQIEKLKTAQRMVQDFLADNGVHLTSGD